MGGLHYDSRAMAKETPSAPVDRITEHLRRQFRIKWKTTRAKQEAMAEAIGKGQSSVSNFLRDQHDLSLDSLDRLARFFGTTLSDMLADVPRPSEDPLITRLRVALASLPPGSRAGWVKNALLLAGMPEMADALTHVPSPPTPQTTARTRRTSRAK